MLAGAIAGFSQVPPVGGPPPPSKTKVKPSKFPKKDLPGDVDIISGTTSERSIIVDPKVSLSMCVNQGSLNVNGWRRNEVRVFVKNGSKFGFKVLQRSAGGDSPVLLMLTGAQSAPGRAPTGSECIWGEEIEIDVPENASLSIKGRETQTTIDSVRKVNVKNIGGDIFVRNVVDGVSASTYEGDVRVENSRGPMVLESSTGNIVAFSAGPSEIGDLFKAKTNSGAISLQKLEYRLAEVNSVSGSVLFSGEIPGGGSLSFGTTNGAIRLSLPQNTSCRISATYGFGNFNSEIPIKILTDDVHPGPVRSVNAMLGTGGATLRLTTNSGSIAIRKQ